MTDYRNTATMREKAQVLANDRKANTMFGRALLELEQERVGRFAKAAQVTAAEAAPEAFAAADWTRQDPGLEPPLNYSIDAMEPTGTCKEIERSRASAGSSTEHDDKSASATPSGDVVRSARDDADGRKASPVSAPLASTKPNVWRGPYE
jgi:hypothetical protein